MCDSGDLLREQTLDSRYSSIKRASRARRFYFRARGGRRARGDRVDGDARERESAIETWVSVPVASRRACDRGDVDDGGVG